MEFQNAGIDEIRGFRGKTWGLSATNNLIEANIMRGSPINLEVQVTKWDRTINHHGLLRFLGF